jgi:hypothetical protein
VNGASVVSVVLLADSVGSVDDEDSVVLVEVLVMFFVKVLGSKEYVALVPVVVSEMSWE